jgi:hypothetical protein
MVSTERNYRYFVKRTIYIRLTEGPCNFSGVLIHFPGNVLEPLTGMRTEKTIIWEVSGVAAAGLPV